MPKTHAVGIDLGTTYSCIAFLNEHGEPVTLANRDGELSTPSVVMFDGSGTVVGTEALRNAIAHPERVVQNAKRFMGDSQRRWSADGASYSAPEVQALILKELLWSARERLGPIEEAVITVPAPFGDIERKATIQAGLHAGLKRVHLINEPVAAALCYVLGSEGLWFTELADAQRILVFDLGGGTFDLSLVRYAPNEVRVIASGGDLNLGGIDFNHALEKAVCDQFTRGFGADPRDSAQSRQALAIEVEHAKRSLSARQRSALTCQHAGFRKTYQIERHQFEQLANKLLARTRQNTLDLLKGNQMGWAHVDVVLLTGGSSRMPMIRNMLKVESGRTLNTSLSPDLSIAHGAAYYAGMLVSNSEMAKTILKPTATRRLSEMQQHSVTARSLGVLVRDPARDVRFPHYLIPASTQLPVSATKTYGTVIPDQRRVHLRVIESGAAADGSFVELGSCVIDDLPPNLPIGSKIDVTMRYDAGACVHVSVQEAHGGKESTIEIVRPARIVEAAANVTIKNSDMSASEIAEDPLPLPNASPSTTSRPERGTPPKGRAKTSSRSAPSARPVLSGTAVGVEGLESAWQPVPLCNKCGGRLDARGQCAQCANPGRDSRAPRLPK